MIINFISIYFYYISILVDCGKMSFTNENLAHVVSATLILTGKVLVK